MSTATPDAVSNDDNDREIEVEDLKASSQAATATVFTFGSSACFSNTEA